MTVSECRPKLVMQWLPDWMHVHVGTSFAKEYYEDYELRKLEKDKLERHLYERFGDIGLGQKKPDVPYNLEFGLCGISNVFGCKIKFFENAWPQNVPLNLSLQEAVTIETPDPAQIYPIYEMLRQAREIKQKYGQVQGEIAHIGILVIALDVRGNDIFMGMHDDPAAVRIFLTKCSAVFAASIRTVRRETGYSGLVVPGNCPLAMISDREYRAFIKEQDVWLSNQFQPFGLHHCGKQDNTITSMAEVPNVSYVDIGITTSPHLVRKHWGADKQLSFVGESLDDKSETQIADELTKLILEVGEPYGRITIGFPATQFTDDSKIRAAFAAVNEFNTSKKSEVIFLTQKSSKQFKKVKSIA